MIHFIQPYSYELNIGKAYNDAIALLPDNDWICITDQDSLKFPSFAETVKEIIDENDTDLVFTCMTNRLAKGNPQVLDEFYNVTDINEHFIMAKAINDAYGSELKPTKIIAGVCMVFHKSTWLEISGFKQDTIRFDVLFSRDCERAGKRLRIALGVYLFHLYRWDKSNPAMSIEHLTKK